MACFMQTAICTLFEGDYHYGVGVLANSLFHHGFQGVFWAGYRDRLPPWATPLRQESDYHELVVSEGCAIRFVRVDPAMHLANYKPHFMWDLLERDPALEAIFYFDPDIVNRCRWDFYEHWVRCGIALCGDSWYHVPANHPRRLAWQSFADDQGFPCQRLLEHHYNAGFIGLPRRSQSLLLLWQKLIDGAAAAGYLDLEDVYADRTTYSYPYLPNDQVTLNLALMLVIDPLSTVGPDGMDFLPGGTIMSHATVPHVKPWRKKLIGSALRGMPPSLTDKLFWQHTQEPVAVYSTEALRQKQLTLRVGAAIGRFIRRS
jgi:hypothetical protein